MDPSYRLRRVGILVPTFAFVIVHAAAGRTTTTNHPPPSFVHSLLTGPRLPRITKVTDTWRRGGSYLHVGASGAGARRGPTPLLSSGGDGGGGSDGSSSSSSPPSITSVVDRLDLHRPFERWVMLRNLLEGTGVHADDVNEVLYLTLSSVPKMYEGGKVAGRRRTVEKEEEWRENHEESPPPSLDVDDVRTVRHILDKSVVVHNGAKIIPALVGPDCTSSVGDDPSVLSDLETLLPDPDEDEDAHKGAWDTVMELHGRESVRMEEEGSGDGREDWDARCLVARVLIYFNFLADGIVGGDGDI